MSSCQRFDSRAASLPFHRATAALPLSAARYLRFASKCFVGHRQPPAALLAGPCSHDGLPVSSRDSQRHGERLTNPNAFTNL